MKKEPLIVIEVEQKDGKIITYKFYPKEKFIIFDYAYKNLPSEKFDIEKVEGKYKFNRKIYSVNSCKDGINFKYTKVSPYRYGINFSYENFENYCSEDFLLNAVVEGKNIYFNYRKAILYSDIINDLLYLSIPVTSENLERFPKISHKLWRDVKNERFKTKKKLERLQKKYDKIEAVYNELENNLPSEIKLLGEIIE